MPSIKLRWNDIQIIRKLGEGIGVNRGSAVVLWVAWGADGGEGIFPFYKAF
jgi:hypothetical protein